MADSSKDRILKKIKQALANPVPLPFPERKNDGKALFQPSLEELEIEFAQNFTQLLGKFSFCANEDELANQLNQLVSARKWDKIYCNDIVFKQSLSKNGFSNFSHTDLATCQASITDCEYLVARTGSIFLSAAQQSGRTTSVYAPAHICIAYTSQLVYDIEDGLKLMQKKYGNNIPSLITLATGPSRTADIEKTLVVGIHGPKEVFVFLVDG